MSEKGQRKEPHRSLRTLNVTVTALLELTLDATEQPDFIALVVLSQTPANNHLKSVADRCNLTDGDGKCCLVGDLTSTAV